MNKNLLKAIFAALPIVLSFASCSDDDDPMTVVSINPSMPSIASDNQAYQLVSGTYEFINATNGRIVTADFSNTTIVLNDGLYNVKFTGTAKVVEINKSAGDEVSVRGYAENVEVRNGKYDLELKLFSANVGSGFVIMEIFGAGTVNPETSKAYIGGEQYFKILNNSLDTLYADGLFIAESQFMTTLKFDYAPDCMSTHMTVSSLWTVPGSGTDYPVAPGDSLLICDSAIDHTEANASSFDLRGADFEWYCESTSATNQDTDNPDVPNLNRLYCSTESIWILNKQGNRAYAIGFLPSGVTAGNFLEDNVYDCSWVVAGKTKSKSYYRIPNEWIVDALNVSPVNAYAWTVVDASLDMGYTYYGENSTTSENYNKGVRRKVDHYQPDGTFVLADSNDSSVDFIPNYTASEISRKSAAE